MNEKLNHSDLIAILANEAKMSSAKAENFTKALFDIIVEGLEEDGIVKINGLGTFKITDVADRYSVNVNTGEKFEIKGHRKLTFVPAETLKESVNRPFAMFVPVEVDETYEDDTENQLTDTESIDNEGSMTNTTNNTIEVEEEIPIDSTVEESVVKAPEQAIDEELPSEECDTEEQCSNIPAEEEKEIVATEDISENVNPEATVINEPEKNIPTEENVAKKECCNDEKEKTTISDKAKERRNRSERNALIAIVALLVIGFGYYWFVEKENSTNKKVREIVLADTRGEDVEEKVKEVIAEPMVPTIDVEKPNNDKQEYLAKKATDIVAEPKVTNEQPVEPTEKLPLFLVDELTARSDKSITDADTTLYVSVGELTVHVVTEDERLAKIANDYYGSRKLWPYIAKYNNLKKPYGITVGMKLIIPALKPK